MTSDHPKLTRDQLIGRATDRLRTAMRLANETAVHFGHDRINSLCILNGLLREGGAWAALALRSVGLNSERLLSVGAVGEFDTADAVFDRACEIANQQGDWFLGTSHVFLAVLNGNDSIAETLRAINIDESRLRVAFQEFECGRPLAAQQPSQPPQVAPPP